MTNELLYALMFCSAVLFVNAVREIVQIIRGKGSIGKRAVEVIVCLAGVVYTVISAYTSVPAPKIHSVIEDGAIKLEMESELGLCDIYFSRDNSPFEKYADKVNVSMGNSVEAYSRLLGIFKSPIAKWDGKGPWVANAEINATIDGDTASLTIRKTGDYTARDGPLFGAGDALVKLDWSKSATVWSGGLSNTKLTVEDMSSGSAEEFHDTGEPGRSYVDISDVASSYFLSGDTKDCVMFNFTNLGVSVTLTKEGLRECLEGSDSVVLSVVRPQSQLNLLRFEVSTENGASKMPGGAVLRIDDFGEDIPVIMNGEYVSAMAYANLGGTTTVRVDSSCQITSSESKYGNLSEVDRGNEAMGFARSRGIFNGDDHGDMRMDSELTRGELIQAIYNMAGCPDVDGYADDVWYSRAEAWAREMGITSMESDDFDGQGYATWEQCVTMLWRLMGKPAPEKAYIADAATVEPYAKTAVAWAIEKGVVSGNMLYYPTARIKRVELAEMLIDLHPAMGELLA